MKKEASPLLLCLFSLLAPQHAHAQDRPSGEQANAEAQSSETEQSSDDDEAAQAGYSATLGSQKDDRGPIEPGFGTRWIATPTVSSNPKLSTAFGAVGMVFLRFDDSVASQLIFGGNYSVSKSWTAFGFGMFNFNHDRDRLVAGLIRGHAANSYENFMNQGIALESLSNILATPLVYYHRLADRTKSDWWAGGQVIYLKLDQSGEDPTSSEIIDSLGLSGAQALSFGPNILFDSRDNTNAPSNGQRFQANGSLWAQLKPADSTPFFGSMTAEYSIYFPFEHLVLAGNAGGRLSWGAPLIFQSSLSQFRAYTVGEDIAKNSLNVQVEARIPFGKSRFGASVFSGVATLFDDLSDWGDLDTYNPMGGAGLRFTINKQQKSIIRLEYAQGVRGARGIYLAMGQAFK